MKHFVGRTFSKVPQDGGLNYENAVFVDCLFDGCGSAGAQIEAVFVDCVFRDHDWYWCVGHSAVFVRRTFESSDLRGAFFTSSFIQCRFVRCQTGSDHLGGTTEWEDCQVSDCVLEETVLPLVKSRKEDGWY